MAVYLIHFDKPISTQHTTQHYIGYAADVEKRLEAHQNGTGARLTAVANERGITYQVVRIWSDGDRTLERRLKNQKNARRYCPVCQGWHAAQTEMRLDPDGDDIWPDVPGKDDITREQVLTERHWRQCRTPPKPVEWDCTDIPW